MDISNRLPAQDLSADPGEPARVPWPLRSGTRLVFLLDARDKFEAQILERWARQACANGAPESAVDSVFIRLKTRQTRQRLAVELKGLQDASVFRESSIWLQPLRVAWFPGARRGAGLLQDLFHGRITHPGPLHRRWLARHQPDRLRCISGEGAQATDLFERFEQRGADLVGEHRFERFIQDQALIALERAERLARGARYKIPRLLPHEVFADQDFRALIAKAAKDQDITLARAYERAERYLREMGASQTPFTLELLTALYRAGVRSNHDPNIDVDKDQLVAVAALIASRPVVFVISHKSILDTVSFSLVLFDANLPVPMTFGGLNLGTFGVGAFARRAGIIFLRRAFQDNEIYKGTFRRYIDYLIEKRFSVIWALEGTRSRTGKLLPPRYGLFNYVVESVLRTGLHNLAFVPVSVAYDQITEVDDYAIEQRGKSKKAEGMGWMLRFFKRGSAHGRIFVRFGYDVSLAQVAGDADLSAPVSDEQRATWVQELARQTALRMNAVTPVTAIAVLTLILLASGRRAQTLAEIKFLARSAAILVRRRKIELVGLTNFRIDNELLTTLGQLHDTGIVSYFDEGVERLYNIQPEQHHKAAYYRNTVIHHFVLDAIVEIALLQGAASKVNQPQAFLDAADQLRELFQYEFYFSQGEQFREQAAQAAEDRFSGWQQALGQGTLAMEMLLRNVRPLVAHGVLRSFVDAYRVVASTLVKAGDAAAPEKKQFLADAMRLGHQELQLTQVFSPEAVSKTLYETAHKLAGNHKLLGAGVLQARRAQLAELAQITACLDRILAMAANGPVGE